MASSPHRRRLLAPCLAAGAWLLAGPVLAQTTRPPLPDPTDPRQPVAPLVYRSALTDTRSPPDAPAVAWPAANAQVGRIGGWRAYAREGAPTAPPSQPDPGVHQHHHGQPVGGRP
ncbi:hypothetical protein [uncultured Aquincola sp.]|uniref:hypothetical protein n=1 Tax=uncultured Aquincola sp. TaxID=886556 RepID=UPI0032B16809